ncbi:MAG: glycosyltransferase family 4 protein [Thermoanaerobaculaceae bacterium]
MHPSRGTFVSQLVNAMVAIGVQSTVVHPLKLHEWFGDHETQVPSGTGGPQILRPVMLSLSNKRIGPLNTFMFTHWQFRHATCRALRRLSVRPDAIYGHFLYSAGETAVWAGERLRIPRFVAVGEGTFWTVRPLGVERAKRDFRLATGVIAVSSVLKTKLQAEMGIPAEKIAVFPNGVDLTLFYPRDKQAMREKYGLPNNAFLVVYVGNFIEPKGVTRVAMAIDGLPGVGGVFVGSGPIRPRASNIVFCGRVSHDQVPALLSAADCFVLPSDVEGSSNATIEAMACGLPVVVSDGNYNDDVVTGDVAIRVPFGSVEAIRHAVVCLQGDVDLRARMAAAATQHAQRFDVRRRAQSVLDWMSALSGQALPRPSNDEGSSGAMEI